MRMIQTYWPNRTLASDLFDEMERYFEDWGQAPARSYDERTFVPAHEVSEDAEHFLMSIDLPGMKKEDIKIDVTGDVLTISGERKRAQKLYGTFKRSFQLPTNIEADKVEARYEDGVLELYLPKVQAAKPRQIEIQSGKSGLTKVS